jgi:hypothetical protein
LSGRSGQTADVHAFSLKSTSILIISLVSGIELDVIRALGRSRAHLPTGVLTTQTYTRIRTADEASNPWLLIDFFFSLLSQSLVIIRSAQPPIAGDESGAEAIAPNKHRQKRNENGEGVRNTGYELRQEKARRDRIGQDRRAGGNLGGRAMQIWEQK